MKLRDLIVFASLLLAPLIASWAEDKLYPLFDKDSTLVAWLVPGYYIYDTDLNWVAYISEGHAWSLSTGDWLGPLNTVCCLDQLGRVVAWNENGNVAGTVKPVRPARAVRVARPARPARPVKPAKLSRRPRPAGGWSTQSFQDWIAQ